MLRRKRSNDQAMEIKVMVNFVFNKIGDLISNDYGEVEYYQEANAVFEDIFGFEKFIDKVGECAGYKELYVLLQRVGFEQVFNLCNAPHMMAAMHDMILIRARLNEIKKEIRKAQRKSKRNLIDNLRKEEKYLVKMYREAAKVFAKKAGIKTAAKNRYKNRYRNLNSLLETDRGKDGWSFYDEEDDYDDDNFDALDHSEFARYAAERGVRFSELDREFSRRGRGGRRGFDPLSDDDSDLDILKNRFDEEYDDDDDLGYEGYGPTTESERLHQDMKSLQDQIVNIAEAVTRLQNFGPTASNMNPPRRPNFNRSLKDDFVSTPPSREDDGVTAMLVQTLGNLNTSINNVNNSIEALAVGQTVMMTPDQRSKFKMAAAMMNGDAQSLRDEFDDDDDDDEDGPLVGYGDPSEPRVGQTSWTNGARIVDDDPSTDSDPLKTIMRQNQRAGVKLNSRGLPKATRSMDQFMEQNIDGHLSRAYRGYRETEVEDAFEAAERTKGETFKASISVEALMEQLDPNMTEEERAKILEKIPESSDEDVEVETIDDSDIPT